MVLQENFNEIVYYIQDAIYTWLLFDNFKQFRERNLVIKRRKFMTTNHIGYQNALANRQNAITNAAALEETKRHNAATERLGKWQTALSAII